MADIRSGRRAGTAQGQAWREANSIPPAAQEAGAADGGSRGNDVW
jgi:hypothetical protein